MVENQKSNSQLGNHGTDKKVFLRNNKQMGCKGAKHRGFSIKKLKKKQIENIIKVWTQTYNIQLKKPNKIKHFAY